MEKLNIILIEDSKKQAKAIKAGYEKAIKAMKDKGDLQAKLGLDEVDIEWMPGERRARMRNDEQYFFYDDTIINKIRQKINDNKQGDIKTGILLDIALSREEYDKASFNDYVGYKIAREIYETFDEEAHVYIITSIREFGSQVLSLVGDKSLLQRYVSKTLVTECSSCGAIARTIKYMVDGKELGEKEETELDKLL